MGLVAAVTLMLFTGMSACENKTGEKQKMLSKGDPEMAQQVKNEFIHAWNAYMKYARGHDALKPLSKKGKNWYKKSLMMTPVDAFDTMILMGLTKESGEAKDLIFKIDFNVDMNVQVFEITIRLLGGLLSAYQWEGDPRFLVMAKDLATRLLPAFHSATGMPYRMVNLKTGTASRPVSNPAEIGTLILEFGTLSKLTGEPLYYSVAKKAMVSLYEKRSSLDLVGNAINVETGEWVGKTSHIGGGIDSYLEYLLKASLLFHDPDFKTMWEKSVVAVNRYVADTSATGLWYGQVDMDTGKRTGTRYGALDAFFPAELVLGGDTLRAEQLQQSDYKMWNLAGVEPEQIDYLTMEITSPAYLLRPENIESAYYLYHFTGDTTYLNMGRTFFRSLKAYCRTDAGYAYLKDVRTKEQGDDMESYFLAETMKYLYLLFAPQDMIDFKREIFNTEAHPLKMVQKSL